MEKPSIEHMFLIYKHSVKFLPFTLNNNQLNSMASDFFMEKNHSCGVDSKYPF